MKAPAGESLTLTGRGFFDFGVIRLENFNVNLLDSIWLNLYNISRLIKVK